MGKCCLHASSFIFDRSIIKVAGDQHRHKILDEFDFGPDQTTPFGVTCPRMMKILIEASSKLLVTSTGIKSRTSLISGRIRLLTLELLALEWWKFYTLQLECLWGQLANLDQILCVVSLGVGKGCIMFWGRLDQNSDVHGNRKPPLTYNGENGVSTFSRLLLIRSFLCLQVTTTCIKSQMSLNFGQIGLLTTELAALEHLKNFP